MSISDEKLAEIEAKAKDAVRRLEFGRGGIDEALDRMRERRDGAEAVAQIVTPRVLLALIARMRAAEADKASNERAARAFLERAHLAEAKLAEAEAVVERLQGEQMMYEIDRESMRELVEMLNGGEFPADDDLWDTMKRERDAAVKRAEKAEAVVAKLPLSADGVPVAPGMLLYSRSEWTARMTAVLNAPEFEANTHIDCMYSTEATASAARAAALAAAPGEAGRVDAADTSRERVEDSPVSRQDEGAGR